MGGAWEVRGRCAWEVWGVCMGCIGVHGCTWGWGGCMAGVAAWSVHAGVDWGSSLRLQETEAICA